MKKKHAMGDSDKAIMPQKSTAVAVTKDEKLPSKLPAKPPPGVVTTTAGKQRDIARANQPRPAKLPSKLPPTTTGPKPIIKSAMGLSGSGAMYGEKAHAHGVSHCVAPVSSGILGASRAK